MILKRDVDMKTKGDVAALAVLLPRTVIRRVLTAENRRMEACVRHHSRILYTWTAARCPGTDDCIPVSGHL